MNKNKFYVTTPIYYVNSKPHLGTLYSTLLADVVARWQKLMGKKVFFLTGTDEHGQKVQEKAESVGMKPKDFVDTMIPAFKEIWELFGIKYDKFIRTTDKEHEHAVTKFLQLLIDKGDIYKSEYSGWYCVPDETFVTVNTETEKDGDGVYLCPTCKRKLIEVKEESYFFRLSAYQDALLDFYEANPDFISPKERINEVISFVKSGLNDLSISRKSVSWGIPFPGDASHTVYVWGDALTNYISAIGYGQDDTTAQEAFKQWWPADMQIMAKDIVRFHAVYWPAFLMAAKLELPKKLLVHGYILTNGQKMSKSLGNAIDPKQLAEWYGSEQVRYYLLRQMPVTQDGQFDLKDLEARITSDLAHSLSNLLHRAATLAVNNGLTEIRPQITWEATSASLREKCEEVFRSYREEMNKGYLHLALAELWKFISEVNAYIQAQQPWVLAKQNKELFAETISAVCHSLHSIALMLWPIMPNKMEELLGLLGHKLDLTINYEPTLRECVWNKTFVMKKPEQPLFVPPAISHAQEIEAAATTTDTVQNKSEQPQNTEITIDEFTKVQLTVGTILKCEPVKGSEKLYRLQVDMGPLGTRQVMSGVAKHFVTDELIGKQGVYVSNLAPRKMMGEISHGMMLFAEDSTGKLKMVTVSDVVENGTRLR